MRGKLLANGSTRITLIAMVYMAWKYVKHEKGIAASGLARSQAAVSQGRRSMGTGTRPGRGMCERCQVA